MKPYLINIISFFVFLAPQLKANSIAYCSHPEICRLIKIMTKNKIESHSLVKVEGDPHEFSPSSGQIKELLSKSPLFVGPSELQPWIIKIIEQRKVKKDLVTFELKFDDKIIKKYQPFNKEALAHFWLYPEIYCDFKKKLKDFSIFKKLIDNEQCAEKILNNKLTSELNKIKIPIILTHDALYPLMTYYGVNPKNIISLKGSGHHDEVSVQSVKELYQQMAKGKVLFVIENNIHVPENIIKRIRKTDKVVSIDSANSPDDTNDFSLLLKLVEELNK